MVDPHGNSHIYIYFLFIFHFKTYIQSVLIRLKPETDYVLDF